MNIGLYGEERTRTAQEMRAHYEAGSSIRNLVNRYGWSYGTTRSLLLSAGTKLRKRGARTVPTTGRKA